MQYTVAPDTSEKMRRLRVIGMLLNVLSLINDQYTIETREFFQSLDSSLDSALDSMEQELQRALQQVRLPLQRVPRHKEDERGARGREPHQHLPDGAAHQGEGVSSGRMTGWRSTRTTPSMGMVQDWLKSHDSTIDVDEFAALYKVTPTRVEQILNRMVSLGYIDVKG